MKTWGVKSLTNRKCAEECQNHTHNMHHHEPLVSLSTRIALSFPIKRVVRWRDELMLESNFCLIQHQERLAVAAVRVVIVPAIPGDHPGTGKRWRVNGIHCL